MLGRTRMLGRPERGGLFFLIMDIYNVFGIRAPRNADQQEAAPGRRISLRGISDAAGRYALLGQAEPEHFLHMRNHVSCTWASITASTMQFIV